MRNFQSPGRSAAMSGEAMAATSHPLATAAALDVLRRGGNAVDAAVTAIAVQCVVEPHMTGIGGDCFALLATADGTLNGLNASGPAAAAATSAYYLDRGIRKIDADSVHSVTVPGAVKGWETLLARHGSWGLDRVLEPAISYAENGFAVTPRVALDWSGLVDRLARDPGAARHYLVEGASRPAGSRHHSPALAHTLRAIAQDGSPAFYTGAVAEDMVATLAGKGGLLTLDDFAGFDVLDAAPIMSDYKGLTIAELPPNGQGLTALIMLNALEGFGLQDLDPNGVDRFHLEMEAGRLAYACRDAAVADPAAMVHDTDGLASKAFAQTVAARIDPQRRNPDLALPPLPHSDTVYVSVVDRDRNACSLINSLYQGFGSAIATEKTGVMFQNRGSCFVVEEGHPNCIDGGKRPMHTIIPAFALKDGRPSLCFGVMGGAYQPVGHTHVVTNMVDYGMDIQEAIDAPRVFWDNESGALEVETALPASLGDGLRARGHDVVAAPAAIGGAQGIAVDWENGLLIGGSDPRKDGSALGF